MKQAQEKPRPTKAVLYCRVSSKAQEKKGHGLASQEACSREYARFKGYEVVEVFRETLTGSTANRPVMTSLMAYLRENKAEGRIVIIDDIRRFARGHRAHWPLRDELKAAGGILESPSMELGDDADSSLLEGVMVTVAQHQRQKNAEQTRNRIRGRVLNGYYSLPVSRRTEIRTPDPQIRSLKARPGYDRDLADNDFLSFSIRSIYSSGLGNALPACSDDQQDASRRRARRRADRP